jgi:regulator of sirC expression with transglutaminase-like and TPR domain
VEDIDRLKFKHEVAGPHPPGLARAALLFARQIAYPGLRPSVCLAELDEWARAVRHRTPPHSTILSRVSRLNDYLFGTLNLRGNQADYDDPRNSFLNEVMARKLGLPITLSVIFIEVGTRLGLKVEGIGLPGHFVVAVRAEAGRYFFDPYHGGGEVTPDDCARLVQESVGHSGPFDPRWLNPSPPESIIVRMLSNLRNVYVQRETWPEAIAVLECLRAAQPEEPEHLRDLGLLHYRSSSPRQAAELFEAYLSKAPNAPDADTVRNSLTLLVDQYARLN